MKTNKSILTSLSLGLVLLAMPITSQASEVEHDGHSAHEHGAGDEMKIPSTIDGIIDKIHHVHNELGETIKEKRLADVHKQAFAIRDLADALTNKVVDTNKKKRVTQTVKKIGEIAKELDNSGDSGNQAKTEANLRKLDGLLKMLDAQFGIKRDHGHSTDEHAHDH